MSDDEEHGRAPLPTKEHPHRDPETGVLVWCERDPMSAVVTWVWSDPETGEQTKFVDPSSIPFEAQPSTRGRKPPSLADARDRITQEAIVRHESPRRGVLNAARVAGDVASPYYYASDCEAPEAKGERQRKHRAWLNSRFGKKIQKNASELARRRYYTGLKERPELISEPLWQIIEKIFGLAQNDESGTYLPDMLEMAIRSLELKERELAELNSAHIVAVVTDLLAANRHGDGRSRKPRRDEFPL